MDEGVLPLCILHETKGKESVCPLKLDPWPVEKLVG